jgi:hypothetical protein
MRDMYTQKSFLNKLYPHFKFNWMKVVYIIVVEVSELCT